MRSESTTDNSRAALRIVVAGGGTGGHISPAVAVVQEIRDRRAVDVLWIGSGNPFEREAADSVGATYRVIQTGKLRRYVSFQTPLDAGRIPIGIVQAWRILGAWKPDVVVSTGGFVSVPTVIGARLRGIPSLTHEQTAHIGLATKINARFADVVALSYERSRPLVGSARGRILVTGNPVRRSVLRGSRETALCHFNLRGELPLLYVTGGAQGSRALNEVVGSVLPELMGYVECIHQCGPASINDDIRQLRVLADQLPEPLRSRYRVVEMVGDELGDIYAAAALVVGRAGAGTVNELSVLGLPSVLIPLPGAEEQHQNARHLADTGGATVIEQPELTPERLVAEVRALVCDADRLKGMAAAARRAAGGGDAAARIADELEDLAKRADA